MVVLIELHPFVCLSITLIVFQGHSNVKQFQMKFFKVFIPLSWNFVRLFITSSRSWIPGQHFSIVFQTLHNYNLAWGLHCHFRSDDLNFVSRSHKCVFWILVLCSLNVVLLLHTLKRLCTIWFAWLWCAFNGDTFSSVKGLGLSKTLTLGFTQTP